MFRRIGWALPGLAVLALAALAPQGASAASNWTARLGTGTAQSRSTTLATPTATAVCNTFLGLGNRIDVSWTAITNATSYQVWQSKNGAAYALLATVAAPAVTYASANLAVGTYSYEVKSLVGTNWASPLSAPSATHTVAQPVLFTCA